MKNQSLVSLTALPDVDGAFLSHRDGRILIHDMPDFLAQEQLQKAARLLNQNRNAASAAVGEINRCEFRFLEHKFFVYYLSQGQLFVLCRPQANPERIDLEVQTLREDLDDALQQTPAREQASTEAPRSVPATTPIPDSQAAKEAHHDHATSPAPKGKSGSRNLVPVLMTVAFMLIALLGAGFFFLLGESRNDTAVASSGAQSRNVATATSDPAAANKSSAPLQSAQIVLRLHGSNTIGAKLAPALAEEFMTQELHAGSILRVAGDKADEQMIEGTLDDGRRIAFEIHAHGSSTSFKDLDKELCDIGMASRPIKDKEVEQLIRFGTLTGPASEHVLALDGIAVIVHPANGVQRLSQQQIADIFSGKTRDWRDIPQSGLNGTIRVIARDDKSGTWDTFKHLVLRGQALVDNAERLEDSRALTGKVAADTNAIGFIGLPYIKPSKAIAVSETGTEAVFPTTFTVATEDYPLARRLFLYIPANPKNPLSRQFIEFALGNNGQRIARETGFVELTIDQIDPTIPPTAPTAYRHSVDDALRLSLNFRFLTGSSDIDNRGLRDIERLVDFLGQPENRNRSIKLFGFADSIGSRSVNCKLSQTRADKVAGLLKSRGITATDVKGFCDDMPVASNETSAGREKNRRVEVWLTQ